MTSPASTSRRARTGAVTLAVLAVLGLAACHRREVPPAPTAEVAAKVNGDDITVQQLEFAMRQRRNIRPDQSDAASRVALDSLIDQQLEMQQAEKLKLDEKPEVQQTLATIRRDLLAREYLKSLAEKAGKPSDADLKKFYDAHPAMFAERKQFNLLRTEVTAPSERRTEVVGKAESSKSAADFSAWLKAQKLQSTGSPMVLSSEQLQGPLGERLQGLKPGQSLAQPGGPGAVVFTLQSVEAAPKTLEQAKPQIEQQIAAETRRNTISNAGKELRKDAKIEYVGKYAQPPASGASASAEAALGSSGPRMTAVPATGGATSSVSK
jgi:EpsD family peptidyl-prolyl cis-trans isomerase